MEKHYRAKFNPQVLLRNLPDGRKKASYGVPPPLVREQYQIQVVQDEVGAPHHTVVIHAVVHQCDAAPQDEEALSEIILRQTTSIGVRSWPVQRRLLRRMQQSVATPYGAIACKIVILPDGSERTAPEATDLERAAREHQVPIARVLEAVLEARGPAEK